MPYQVTAGTVRLRLPRPPPRGTAPEPGSGNPIGREHAMPTATLTHTATVDADPFDLDAALVIDPAAVSVSRRSDSDDGCGPTCPNSCVSGS